MSKPSEASAVSKSFPQLRLALFASAPSPDKFWLGGMTGGRQRGREVHKRDGQGTPDFRKDGSLEVPGAHVACPVLKGNLALQYAAFTIAALFESCPDMLVILIR